MFEKTKQQLDDFLSVIPGFDFMVYRNGEPLFRYQGGYNDLEAKTPITGKELFRIYSCTKPITVTAAMQLWEQNKFSLDDRLSDYLPAYRETLIQTENGPIQPQNPIYIRNLFTMTAGLSYNYRSEQLLKLREQNPAPTTRQVADALSKDLIAEPGDHYHYSLCHDVLGALIEELSGESLQDYVKNHIFDPLGMAHTTYCPTPEQETAIAALYRFNQETQKPERCKQYDRVGPNFISGGGGCVSTIDDYMKFAEALRDGERLLKRSTIELMTQNHLTEHQARTFTINSSGYGLGMRAPLPGGKRHDFGWGGAAGALLSVDPVSGLSIVYMQHVLSSPNQKFRSKVVRTFCAELYGVEDDFRQPEYTRDDLTY